MIVTVVLQHRVIEGVTWLLICMVISHVCQWEWHTLNLHLIVILAIHNPRAINEFSELGKDYEKFVPAKTQNCTSHACRQQISPKLIPAKSKITKISFIQRVGTLEFLSSSFPSPSSFVDFCYILVFSHPKSIMSPTLPSQK